MEGRKRFGVNHIHYLLSLLEEVVWVPFRWLPGKWSSVKARQRGHQNEGLSSHLHYQIHARQALWEEHHCLCHTYGKESLMQSQGQWDFLSVFLVNISFSTPLPPSPPLPPVSSSSFPHPRSLSISLHLLSFFSFQTSSLPLFCVLYQIYEIQLKIIFYICNISTWLIAFSEKLTLDNFLGSFNVGFIKAPNHPSSQNLAGYVYK